MNSQNNISLYESLGFEDCWDTVSNVRISFLQKELGITFPTEFINCMKFCNGGTIKKSGFKYFDKESHKKRESSVGVFLCLAPNKYSDFYNDWKNPPEFFPEGLIAFAETGNGDSICFDYRQEKNNSNPPIVYWNHEADIGKDVSLLANNFEEFLGMLKEPEDL
jgi:hypothetical protein